MYFLCSLHSQKAASLARDRRISLTIDCDTFDARRSQVFRWQLRPSESATQLKSPRLWICFRREAPIHSDPDAETGGHHRLPGAAKSWCPRLLCGVYALRSRQSSSSKDRFRNRQRPFSLDGRNCSSCPIPDLGPTRPVNASLRANCRSRLARTCDARVSQAIIARRSNGLRRCAYFSAAAGRSTGRAISSNKWSCPSSEARITAWT